MRRWRAVAGATVLAALLVASCGASGDGDSGPAGPPSTGPADPTGAGGTPPTPSGTNGDGGGSGGSAGTPPAGTGGEGSAPARAAATTVVAEPARPSSCPTFEEAGTATDGGPLGTTAAPLGEVSGLVASRANPGLLWVHNDSGDRANLYLVDEQLRIRSTVELPGVFALDWEAVSAGPGPDGRPWLWVADVGDNLLLRPFVTLHGFPEPALGPDPPPVTGPEEVVSLQVRYPDGPSDVESFAVDPRTGEGVLVTKTLDPDGRARVLRVLAESLWAGGEVDAEDVGATTASGPEQNGPRAADIAQDGTLVAVKDLARTFVWLRGPGQAVPALLVDEPQAPCAADLGRGEALGFSVDGTAVFTLEEGIGKPLRRFVRTG